MTTEGTKEWQGEVDKLTAAIASLTKIVNDSPKADPKARETMQASLTSLREELAELKKSISAGEATVAEVKSLKQSISELAATVAELAKKPPTPTPPPEPEPKPNPGKNGNTPGDKEPGKTPERRIKAWV